LRYIRVVSALSRRSGTHTRRALSACLLALALFFAATLHGDSPTTANNSTHLQSPIQPPPIVLWAWEEPEDLRAADPQRLGVAFLADRIFVSDTVKVVPRHQRILVPPSIWAEAVVRIEAAPGFQDNETTRSATANDLLQAARLPRIRGIEVDFDATAAQRNFYTDVLRQLRAALPPGERLEITALVSWCAQPQDQSQSMPQGQSNAHPQSWLHSLPVDAAIPMNFRLGQHVGSWPVREPLCMGTTGISTDEPGLQESASSASPRPRTIYIFSPRPWTHDQLVALNRGLIPQDTKGATE
jgi:hypothetical protein